jgi:acetyl coenzyme A synthetase (ADP forming)-like protein
MPTLFPFFFSPRGVVVVGASQDTTKLGYALARNLISSKYPGTLHFVNPKGGYLFDHPVFHSILDVPDPVDLAVLLIPAPYVPDALHQCGQRGVQGLIISSGGFREVSSEGAELEKQCVEIAHQYGMRIIGPNCIGLVDTHLPINTTFLSEPGPLAGDIAIISQSGAICASMIDWARGNSFGISRMASLGNQADITETDVLAPIAFDPWTKVILLYLEGTNAGRHFVDEALKVSQQKPIIVMKVGRFASGRRAASSHTGALVGEDTAYDAAFRRAGIIRANNSDELFDWARALAWSQPLHGDRIAILTNSGGPGVITADAIEAYGLHFADFSETTISALRTILPPAAGVLNPVDLLGTGSPEQFNTCLEILLADPNIDGIIVVLVPPPLHPAEDVAQAIIPTMQQATKPVLTVFMGEFRVRNAGGILSQAHIPEYRFPERAVSALAVLSRRTEFLKRKQEPPIRFTDVKPEVVHQIIESMQIATLRANDLWLSQEVILKIFGAYGISTLPMRLVNSAEEAADIAKLLGLGSKYTGMALKIASPDIIHKSDVGGVLLNLPDADAVAQGYLAMMESVHRVCPQARIDGIHLQPMAPQGQELILGSIQDPQFGALLMFGAGGTEVEGMGDVAFSLAPLTAMDVEYLLNQTWAGKKLKGFRNLASADREAVIEALCRLAQLAYDFPQLAEIEINPLRALPQGRGVIALDMRVRYQANK